MQQHQTSQGNTSAAAHYKLGLAKIRAGELQEATECFSRAIKADPTVGEYYFCLAECLQASGQSLEAIKAYNEALNAGLTSSEVYCKLGISHINIKRLEKANEWLKKALEQGLNDPVVHYNVGQAYILAGSYEDAIHTFTKALDLKPDKRLLASIHFCLGECFRSLDKRDAVEAYQKALQLGADPDLVLPKLGKYLFVNGDYQEAASVYYKAMERKHDDPEIHAMLSHCLFHLGSLEEASLHAWRSIELNPSRHAYKALGKVMLLQEKVDELTELFDRTVKENPSLGLNLAQTVYFKQAAELPSVLLCTLPKSGSIYLMTRLSNALRLLPVRLQFENVMGKTRMLNSWIEAFTQGGCLAHGHFESSADEVFPLLRHGINRMVLHVREPRQATVSFLYSLENMHSDSALRIQKAHVLGQLPPRYWSWSISDKLTYHIYTFFNYLIRWLQGWFALSRMDDPPLEILLTNFDELVDDEMGLFKRILDFYKIPLNKADFSGTHDSRAYGHHRKGSKDEWRTLFTDEQRNYTWSRMRIIAKEFGWAE
jgi:tetratricopeptide (TPR) repeat protein